MIRKMIANWLLKGIRKDLESQAREVFLAALVSAFREMEESNVTCDREDSTREHGFAYMTPEYRKTDMWVTMRSIVRGSIQHYAEKSVNKHTERLAAARQSIPETVAAEVIREPVIDTIIAKINSKQLKGGIPT